MSTIHTRLLSVIILVFLALPAAHAIGFDTGRLSVTIEGDEAALWTYHLNGAALPIAPPAFSIDGHTLFGTLSEVVESAAPRRLANGTTEYVYAGHFRTLPSLSLELRFRAAAESPVVRFAYALRSANEHHLTKPEGRDSLTYLGVSLKAFPQAREVRLAEFLEQLHSYTVQEYELDSRQFTGRVKVMGPIFAASDGRRSMLVAYEHGSQAPDAFLHYALSGERSVSLSAVKANYLPGQPVAPGRAFETVWFETAMVNGGLPELRAAYRDFVLHYLGDNDSARKPLIFYNTWNFQERNKHWYHHAYLDSMNEQRMLEEIDVAHRIGIDVFVIDTGWYEKTGDWRVSSKRFPNGLTAIKKQLDGYGMRLGLWFDPTAAAISSAALSQAPEAIMSWKGRRATPQPIWETEASYRMCLVSRWADVFAEELIRANRDYGVTYFKWDAVGQYGCDSPDHNHGDASVTADERAQSYAFQLPKQMAYIARKINAAVPGAIVDFDITESGRAVGLSFLSAGKYYLVNNGPYYQNYDVPINPEKDNWNLFFYKGPARTWIMRGPLTYDSWIPSVLFMSHYIADDPADSQIVNIGSLILGQNGIWGDLPRISEDGVAMFGRLLGQYKQVRDDITASYPVRTGAISGASEIHEKINRNGRGVIVIFSTTEGTVDYVSANKADRHFSATKGAAVEFDNEGRAVIRARFDKPGAAIVFFGVK